MAIVCVYSQDHFLCGSKKNSKNLSEVITIIIFVQIKIISFHDLNSH